MSTLALITGASRGLGAALAETLAPRFHIMAVGRTVGALEELDDRIKAKGGSATLAPLDIADPGAVAHLAGSIQDRWGAIDLWCHTAVHAPPLAPAGSIAASDWTKSMETNLTATATLIPAVEALLLAAPNGQALFFDDPKAGDTFFGAYGATKAGQIALARSWQAETQKIGPKVHILTPVPMPTATRARFFPGEDRAPLADPKSEAERLLTQAGIL